MTNAFRKLEKIDLALNQSGAAGNKVTMNIFLTGVSCVGKSTIGKIFANKINYPFFDLDDEIEKYFRESIERLRSRYFTGMILDTRSVLSFSKTSSLTGAATTALLLCLQAVSRMLIREQSAKWTAL